MLAYRRMDPGCARRPRAAFNLVEVMITLTMVALLTTTLISFVNDYDDKSRLAKAKNDLARLASAAVLAESKSGQRLSPTTDEFGSVRTSEIPTLLQDYIVALPAEDPWGNRYVVSVDGTVNRSSTEGTPYILDAGFGRFICAGPDGVVNTVLGQGISDQDNDIVVEYRQQPFLAFAGVFAGDGAGVWITRVDGTRKEKVQGSDGMVNVVFSPDGARWAGVNPGNGRLWVGNTSAVNSALTSAPPLPLEGSYTVSEKTYPFFFPDGNHVGWVNGDGSLRVFDLFAADNDYANATRLLAPALTFTEDDAQMTDDLGRIVHVSANRTYYFRHRGAAETSIAIAVAPDGKVAYGKYTSPRNKADGIYLVLPDGSGTRRIRKGGLANTDITGAQELDWMPLFWANSNDLVYSAKDSNNRLHVERMAQDGRLKIELFPAVLSDISPRDPLVASINPSGDLIAFTHTDSGDTKVIKVDGSGFFKPLSGNDFQQTITNSKTNSGFPLADLVLYQEALWDQEGRGLFYAVDDSTNGIVQVDFRLDQPNFPPQAGSIDDNPDVPVVPGSMALSPDGTLIAAVSYPGGAGAENGVYVIPVFGPSGARSVIHDSDVSGAATSVRVVWLSD